MTFGSALHSPPHAPGAPTSGLGTIPGAGPGELPGAAPGPAR